MQRVEFLTGCVLDALKNILRKGISVSIPFSWTGYKKMPPTYTYFSDAEVKGLDPDLCALLDRARGLAGVPFLISSGLRTPDHNQAVGGADNSAHLRGLAVDLVASDSVTRFKVVNALLSVGFKRLGIYLDGHVHCDIAPDLPEGVIWLK